MQLERRSTRRAIEKYLPRLKFRRRSILSGHRLAILSADKTSLRRSIPAHPHNDALRKSRNGLFCKSLRAIEESVTHNFLLKICSTPPHSPTLAPAFDSSIARVQLRFIMRAIEESNLGQRIWRPQLYHLTNRPWLDQYNIK